MGKSDQEPFALVFRTGEDPATATDGWNHIRFVDFTGISDDLKVGSTFAAEKIKQRVIDTKKDVPGFWVNAGSKVIHAFVQISDTEYEVQEVYNPFFEYWIKICTPMEPCPLTDVGIPDGGWRWSVRPNLYEIIENGSVNYWREGYHDVTSGVFHKNEFAAANRRVVHVDIEDSFGNLLSEKQIMNNFAAKINDLNKEGGFQVIATVERGISGAATCFLTNLSPEQALTPSPIYMVDNRPETTNVDGIAANHTEDFDYPVAEAFFVNGFIKGERYTPSFYEWDSQPKNNDRSTQRIANIAQT